MFDFAPHGAVIGMPDHPGIDVAAYDPALATTWTVGVDDNLPDLVRLCPSGLTCHRNANPRNRMSVIAFG
jgi:hypothetical protein